MINYKQAIIEELNNMEDAKILKYIYVLLVEASKRMTCEKEKHEDIYTRQKK